MCCTCATLPAFKAAVKAIIMFHISPCLSVSFWVCCSSDWLGSPGFSQISSIKDSGDENYNEQLGKLILIIACIT